MGCMTVRYYEVAKDYLHPHLNSFINHYRYENFIAIGKKPKDKYRRKIGHLYWTRYMTRTNLRHLFRNKGNFINNHKQILFFNNKAYFQRYMSL